MDHEIKKYYNKYPTFKAAMDACQSRNRPQTIDDLWMLPVTPEKHRFHRTHQLAGLVADSFKLPHDKFYCYNTSGCINTLVAKNDEIHLVSISFRPGPTYVSWEIILKILEEVEKIL